MFLRFTGSACSADLGLAIIWVAEELLTQPSQWVNGEWVEGDDRAEASSKDWGLVTELALTSVSHGPCFCCM